MWFAQGCIEYLTARKTTYVEALSAEDIKQIEKELSMLLAEAKEIMDEDYDSLIIFKSRSDRWLEKEVIGREQNDLDCFL
ncbi:hypothetical protein SapgrDRAFT_0378 [Saprospira grandis DSM 2844]|uniref:Uncharacterized protein n=1 Tax=Saprospira grandis DSM 2844 TaxID=694433 RepID=J0NXB9_9BACT|nr:CRISPR-associated endonuclease Cas2 [Saprospira grandis]EJF52124.1 hypothetical protein SapgrDRAFT_0378 [Saprospira grandis DSM 2844]